MVYKSFFSFRAFVAVPMIVLFVICMLCINDLYIDHNYILTLH